MTLRMTVMSFIDKTLETGYAAFNSLPIVSVGNLKSALAGKTGIAVNAALSFAESQITPKLGSTLLRQYFRSLRSTDVKQGFTQAQYSSIAHEINFITKGKRAVSVTSSPYTTTVVTRTVGATNSVKGLEYAAWFTHRPIDGELSSKVSNSRTVLGVTRAHKGVDFRASVGTPVSAVGIGVVTVAGVQTGYGKVVYISHGNGLTTRYAHLSSFNVKVGDNVKGGQVIALSGNTGRTTGPHLHFEVRDSKGGVLDPLQYLNALGQVQLASKVKPMLKGSLEANPQIWIQRVFDRVQSHGSADVKQCFRSKTDVQRILELEGGLVNGKMVLNASHGSFVGPFQVGNLAWIDGPAAYSGYKKPSISLLKQLNQSFAIGGPGDIDTMAPGIVRFWNNCWSYFFAAAREKGLTRYLAKVPRTVEMQYLLHNQGPGGALKLLTTSGNPVDSRQSADAQKVGLTVRAQYRA